MAVCILMNHPFEREIDIENLRTEELSQKDLKTMKAFRKVKSDNYGYLILADHLLKKYREGNL
jgi:hypothetical protein